MTITLTQGARDQGYKDVCHRCRERFVRVEGGMCGMCYKMARVRPTRTQAPELNRRPAQGAELTNPCQRCNRRFKYQSNRQTPKHCFKCRKAIRIERIQGLAED